MSMPAYRITVDKLDALDSTTGEGGLESISFFASTPHDILAAANSLRDRLDCSACHATRLVVGLSLLSEAMPAHRDPALFTEPMRQLLGSLQAAAAEAIG
jgi:hypothetical protein